MKDQGEEGRSLCSNVSLQPVGVSHLAAVVLAQTLFQCALRQAAPAAVQEIAFAKRRIGVHGALAIRAGAFRSL